MNRRERLQKLIDWYGQAVEDYDSDVEEDLRPYLNEGHPEPKAPGRYVCVTQHGEKTFFLPFFDSLGEAQERAVEYVNDDIFAEQPVEVFDLDTGEAHMPEWSKIEWEKRTRSRAQGL